MMDTLLKGDGISAPPDGIFLAKVIAFNAHSGTVDVTVIDSDISIYGCMVACPTPAGFNFGTTYVPAFQSDNETPYVMSSDDIYCLATFTKDYSNAAVIGFLFPKQTELSVPEYGLYLFRHESDVVLMIRADGTLELYHPSGSYIKVGDGENDLVGTDQSSGGLYPARAAGFRVRDKSKFPGTMGLFIRFWAGQKATMDKSGNIVMETGISKATMTPTTTTLEVGARTKVNMDTDNLNLAAKNVVITTSSFDVNYQA